MIERTISTGVYNAFFYRWPTTWGEAENILIFCFYKKKVQKVFTKTKNISHFYKNNVNWSRGWVVLKFSFVLNNRPLFSTLIFSLLFYKIVLIKFFLNFRCSSGVRNWIDSKFWCPNILHGFVFIIYRKWILSRFIILSRL